VKIDLLHGVWPHDLAEQDPILIDHVNRLVVESYDARNGFFPHVGGFGTGESESFLRNLRGTPLARLRELLSPAVAEILGDVIFATERGDAFLSAQAFEHDADLLLG